MTSCYRLDGIRFNRKFLVVKQACRKDTLIQQEIEQAARLRDRVMTAFGFREPDSFRLTVIPGNFSKTLGSLTTRPGNLRAGG